MGGGGLLEVMGKFKLSWASCALLGFELCRGGEGVRWARSVVCCCCELAARGVRQWVVLPHHANISLGQQTFADVCGT